MNELRKLAREYQSTPVADELESMMRDTIHRQEKRMRSIGILRTSIACVAAAALIFAGAVNFSPATASAMSRIPVLKNLVRLVMFTRLSYQDGTHVADVKVPQVQGLENEELEASLNAKYLDRNAELYSAFLEGLGEDSLSPEVLALYTNYKVKTNTEDLLVVESIVTAIGASGTETVRYDNIDLEHQIVITLPSLFKDDQYIDVISADIKSQMRKLTDREEGIMYFIEGDGTPGGGGFAKIAPEQTFYINADSKLVIVFDEYAVAPGSMGIVEFVIPTRTIQDLLVSNAYIQQ